MAGAAAGGVLFGGYQAYEFFNCEPVEVILPEFLQEFIEKPETEFVHPYADAPWYFKWYVKVKRFIYLAALFTPITIISILCEFTDDPAWRTYWIEKLISTLEHAGCSFQKFAQWMSMRPDMVPADLCKALGDMHNACPTHDFEHTQKTIKECFGKDIDEIFEEFDPVPVASGTVAQVHKARLREEYCKDGLQERDVAVKVRHPNVIEEVYADFDIWFATVDFLSAFTRFSLPFNPDDFKDMMRKQIDFRWEAYNMVRFQEYFKNETLVKFPTVSVDLLSETVIVQSWIPGKTVSEVFSVFGDKYDEVKGEFSQKTKDYAKKLQEGFSDEVKEKKRALAKIVFDLNMKMFLRDNYVHGDMHGGNIMYQMDEKGKTTLTVIDTGLVTEIGSDYAQEFGMFLHGLCTGNPELILTTLKAFSISPKENTETPKFEEDILKVINEFSGGPGIRPDGGPMQIGDFLGEVLNTLQRNNVTLRGDVANNIVTMSVSEGLIRRLDPDFDVVGSSLPYFVRYRAWNTPSLSSTVDLEKQKELLANNSNKAFPTDTEAANERARLQVLKEEARRKRAEQDQAFDGTLTEMPQ